MKKAKIHDPRLRSVVGLLSGIKARNLLDIGCSDGAISRVIGETVGASKIYGVDRVEMALKIA